MNESIVVIDSSDEDNPPKKKIKLKTSNTVANLQIAEIKSLADEDIVVIDDEEDCVAINENIIKINKTNGDNGRKNTLKNDIITLDNTIDLPNNNIVKNELQNFNIFINSPNENEEIKIDSNSHKRIALIKLASQVIQNETIISDIINENDNSGSFKSLSDTESIYNDNLVVPSTSTETNDVPNNEQDKNVDEITNESNVEFEKLIEICLNCECNSKYKELIERKIPNLRIKFTEAEVNYINSKQFHKLIAATIENIKRKPNNIIIYFNDFYKELRFNRKRSIELTDKQLRNLDKLYIILKKINKKIKSLEESECNWEDESNSQYLIEDRYKRRATLIHSKICSILKENPYASRQIYKNLDISCSKYTEFNRAVDKMYVKTKQFPSYSDVDKCLRKCVKQNNIAISESTLEVEIKNMFKNVGELLIRRRKAETYEYLNTVEGVEEQEDPELKELLDKRHVENEKRIDEVINKFTASQDKGEDPAISSDSDDSNHESEELSD